MTYWNEILQIIFIIIGATAAVFTAYATLKSAKLSHRSLQKPRFQKIVDIVIVPLLENVKRQMNFLENKDYRWKYRGIWEIGKFKPITLDYETEHFHNEFKDKHLNIYHKIEKHDEKTDELEKELDFFAEKIRSFPDFKKEVSKMLEEYRDYVEGARKNHFESTNDNIECILRYIVNNEGELEQDNLYRDFWNRYRNKLLKFREREELKERKAKIEKKREELYYLLKDIYGNLKDALEKYEKEYGVIPKIEGKF